MYHHKTKFILLDPYKDIIFHGHSKRGGKYPNYDRPYSHTRDKFNITNDYYKKVGDWATSGYIIRKEHNLFNQLPKIFQENKMLPIKFIKRTLYDINDFFQVHFKIPLNVLDYSLFIIDLIDNIQYLSKNQKLVYFEIKIREYLDISNEMLNMEILIYEHYKMMKNAGYYQKFWNTKLLAKNILFDYIYNECVKLFYSNSLSCIHDHNVKFCDNCNNLTIHRILWNVIKTSKKYKYVNNILEDMEKNDFNKKKYDGKYCINVEVNFEHDPRLDDIINKSKLCELSIQGMPSSKNQLDITNNRFVKYYQCWDCQTKSKELKFSNGQYSHMFITQVQQIKKIVCRFVEKQIKAEKIIVNYKRTKKFGILINLDQYLDQTIFEYIS